MVDFVKSIPELRARVPVTQQWAYFETASTGLVPDFVYDGVRRYLDDRYRKGGNSVWEFPDTSVETLEMMQRSKAALGEMIHGAPDRITFGQSSTQLFTMVTEAVEYGPEDNVVAVDRGGVIFLQNYAGEARRVTLLRPYEELISGKTLSGETELPVCAVLVLRPLE